MFDSLMSFIPVQSCIKSKENDDFLIVMNENSEVYYLNETAKYIFESIDSKISIGDIFYNILSEYAIEKDNTDNVKNDIIDIIRDFQWQKIIYLKEEKYETV